MSNDNAGLLVFFGVVFMGLLWLVFIETPRAERRRKERDERNARFRERRRAWENYDDEHYGDFHKAERKQYESSIRQFGGWCTERVCVMPSRQIAPGAFWHLAHDHQKGGPQDYLGPAHPECNENEARGRGVTFSAGVRHPIRPSVPRPPRNSPPKEQVLRWSERPESEWPGVKPRDDRPWPWEEPRRAVGSEGRSYLPPEENASWPAQPLSAEPRDERAWPREEPEEPPF